jgi:UDP-glucose 4-epimerase
MQKGVKNVLVVGSKGFLGQHAYQAFQNNSAYRCWGCDVVTEYNDPNYFLIDSSNSDFNEIFETEAFDFCINCSGAASVPDSLKHPLRDFSLNTFNVIKLLDAIRKHAPHCRFVNLSSAAVYGSPTSLPVAETALNQPISPYGQHKLMAEDLCREYYEYFGVSSCSLRIFSAYGPGLRKQLLWDIFQKTFQTDSIRLFGTGKESRDFIFITDIVRAIVLVMERGEFDARTYNLASGTETTVQELVSELLPALGYTGNYLFSGSNRSGDPINWRADVNRLRSLGFVPEVTVQEGVKHYVKWLSEKGLR